MRKLQFCGDVWLPKGSVATVPGWAMDGLVINLEGPITSGGVAANGKICLATDKDCFTAAFPTLPAAACLANNHIMDYGDEGFVDTVNFLEAHGVAHFGAGTLEARCNNPLLLTVNGSSVALMGYVCPSTHPIWAGVGTSGVVPIELARIKKDIAIARERGAEYFVLSLHWGDEQVSLPKPKDVELTAQLLDLGVDLIIGHHAHCRQPVFLGDGQHVFFGLGNALFSDFVNYSAGKVTSRFHQRWWNRETALVQFTPKLGVSWKGMRFQDGSFRPSALPIGRQTVWNSLPPIRRLAGYERRYRRVKRWCKLRAVFSRFLARPRWPSWRTFTHATRNVFLDE